MKIYEIGTGYTSIPAQMGAATEIVVEELTKIFAAKHIPVEIIDIEDAQRPKNNLPITEVHLPGFFNMTDLQLGIMHKMKRVVYSVALAGKLRKIVKRSSKKVVLHFHNQYNLFFFSKLSSARLRKKCLIIYTNHSGIWRLPWNEIQSIIRKRYFQEAACMKCADIVFALNRETIQNAVEHLHIPEDHFRLINNGVNVDIYRPLDEAEKQHIKEQQGLSGKHILLQVGSVYENKGQLRSLHLLAPMLQKNRDLVYAYAGGIVSEEYHQQVQAAAKQLGVEQQVLYLGIIAPGEALNRLYNIADATIFASHYEAFGLVIIESLSAGTPVLLEESAPFSFGDGCVPYSQSSIAYLISCLMDDSKRASLVQEARANAVNNYSWKRVSEDYLTSLEK